MRLVLVDDLQPIAENVSSLKTRGATSGFVSTWEKASNATIASSSGGSTSLRPTSSANSPT